MTRTEATTNDASLAVAVLCLGLIGGSALLAANWVGVRNEATFERHATTATAVVLETGDPDRSPGSIDVLVFPSERRHRFEVGSSEDYEVGQRVRVLVDRNDPDQMRLVGEWVNFVSTPIEAVSVLGFGAAIVAIPCGLWMLVWGYRTRRRASRVDPVRPEALTSQWRGMGPVAEGIGVERTEP
jgi:hypothetical protein